MTGNDASLARRSLLCGLVLDTGEVSDSLSVPSLTFCDVEWQPMRWHMVRVTRKSEWQHEVWKWEELFQYRQKWGSRLSYWWIKFLHRLDRRILARFETSPGSHRCYDQQLTNLKHENYENKSVDSSQLSRRLTYSISLRVDSLAQK